MGFFNYYVLYKGAAICYAAFLYCVTFCLGSPVTQGVFIDLFFDFLYSIFLTFFHVVVTAIYDQDVPKAVAAKTPELYTPGLKRVHFSMRGFALWSLDALWSGLVVIYLPVLAVSAEAGGFYDDDRYALSWLSMWIVTLGVTFRMWPEVHSWSVLEYSSNAFSIGLLIMFGLVFSYVAYPNKGPFITAFTWDEFNDFVPRFFPDFEWWCALVLGVLLIVFPTLVHRGWHALHSPPLVLDDCISRPSQPTAWELPKPRSSDGEARSGGQQPRRTSLLMAVPPEEEMVREERRVSVLRASLDMRASIDMRGSIHMRGSLTASPLAAAGGVVPGAAAPAAPSSAAATAAASTESTRTTRTDTSFHTSRGRQITPTLSGFAFSSSDVTSQIMWEREISSRQRLTQASSRALTETSSRATIELAQTGSRAAMDHAELGDTDATEAAGSADGS